MSCAEYDRCLADFDTELLSKMKEAESTTSYVWFYFYMLFIIFTSNLN